MGAAGAPQADVPRRSPRREDRARLLRVRRDREEGTGGPVDPPDLVRTDEAKAALWGAIAGIAQLVAALAPIGRSASYDVFVAIGFGLMLPVIAVIHARHARVRGSGAILGTIGGTAVVTIGIAASASAAIAVAALFVRGVWWWTIGKTWWETALLPRALGAATMALAGVAFAVALASAATDISAGSTAVQVLLGLWLLAVSAALFGTR